MSKTATWTASRTGETVASVDEDKSCGTGRRTWSRFWLGIGCVTMFVVSAVLFVAATHGARAGANCGLVLLVVTLVAVSIDGAVLIRRRNRDRTR